jgi:hypothetical protein
LELYRLSLEIQENFDALSIARPKEGEIDLKTLEKQTEK